MTVGTVKKNIQITAERIFYFFQQFEKSGVHIRIRWIFR
jgi:hypothetical protein